MDVNVVDDGDGGDVHADVDCVGQNGYSFDSGFDSEKSYFDSYLLNDFD